MGVESRWHYPKSRSTRECTRHFRVSCQTDSRGEVLPKLPDNKGSFLHRKMSIKGSGSCRWWFWVSMWVLRVYRCMIGCALCLGFGCPDDSLAWKMSHHWRASGSKWQCKIRLCWKLMDIKMLPYSMPSTNIFLISMTFASSRKFLVVYTVMQSCVISHGRDKSELFTRQKEIRHKGRMAKDGYDTLEACCNTYSADYWNDLILFHLKWIEISCSYS